MSYLLKTISICFISLKCFFFSAVTVLFCICCGLNLFLVRILFESGFMHFCLNLSQIHCHDLKQRKIQIKLVQANSGKHLNHSKYTKRSALIYIRRVYIAHNFLNSFVASFGRWFDRILNFIQNPSLQPLLVAFAVVVLRNFWE